MLTLAMPVDTHPICADPQYRDVVDAAFEQTGGPESHWMRDRLCPGCPVWRECLLLGNTRGEHGIWGGITSKQRADYGGRPAYRGGNYANLAGLMSLRGTPHGRRKGRGTDG